jgi:hypothetical protein
LGESKIPIYAYVDESGNTGKNIFDPAQPDFYTAALITHGDFDILWGPKVRAIARKLGHNEMHANELGLGRLEEIADDLAQLILSSRANFFVCRVEKRYLLATKLFDVLFDSGENAAVSWHNYNIKPLKIVLAFKLSLLVDEPTARLFWKCLLLPNEAEARQLLPKICEAILARITELPDERSQEILGEGLRWVITHPEAIQITTTRKIATQGHFPNLVAFTNLLNGLETFSKLRRKRIALITHDEQSEFQGTLATWHERFSNAAPDLIHWVGETFSVQMAAGSQFRIKSDTESPGIQIADVALWLFGQFLKGKTLPIGCTRLLELILVCGWHNDFSFKGVETSIVQEWGHVPFGPLAPENAEKAARMLKFAEARRLDSMAQFETDGLPPFMRSSKASD